MTNQKNIRFGFMMTELIVSITVLSIILIAFALSLDGFKRLNSFNLVKQRCISAAQANLDSIAVTAKPIDSNDVARLWPGMTIKIDESQGTGQWNGLNLVIVTAEAMSFDKKVEISLSQYFLKVDNALAPGRRLSAVQEK